MANACRLCHVRDDPDQHLIFGDEVVSFLQNTQEQGALRGSGIIIPVRHAETVFDLTPDEVSATFALLQHVKGWMDAHYHPDGYNVGWNCGAVGGQTDQHAHLHVMPRFRQEPYAGRGIRSWLKQPENRWWAGEADRDLPTVPPSDSGYVFTDTHALPWRQSTVAEGVEVKDLGTVNGQSMQRVQCAAGAHFPIHLHPGPEFIYMIAGEAVQEGQRLGPGWASAAAAGTSDEHFHSPSGCTFVIMSAESRR
jgi:diadenosine tetraphosphate (Ap4A) HIT family hydrolase